MSNTTNIQHPTISLDNICLAKNGDIDFVTVLSNEPCQGAGNISLSTQLLATALENHAIRLYIQNSSKKEPGDENPVSKNDPVKTFVRNPSKQMLTRQGAIFAVTVGNNKDFPGWPGSPLMTSFKYYFGTIQRVDSVKSFILLKYIL